MEREEMSVFLLSSFHPTRSGQWTRLPPTWKINPIIHTAGRPHTWTLHHLWYTVRCTVSPLSIYSSRNLFRGKKKKTHLMRRHFLFRNHLNKKKKKRARPIQLLAVRYMEVPVSGIFAQVCDLLFFRTWRRLKEQLLPREDAAVG